VAGDLGDDDAESAEARLRPIDEGARGGVVAWT